MLERIATAIEEQNVLARKSIELANINSKNNEIHLEEFIKSVNFQLASTLSNLSSELGDNTIAFIEALQKGDLVKANEIVLSKNDKSVEVKPKKRGRKPKVKVEND